MTVNVLVLGATGVVGFGVCHAWLDMDKDSHIYAVDNRKDALGGLAERLGLNENDKQRLTCIEGDIAANPQTLVEKVKTCLQANTLHHVVSAIGCSSPDLEGTVSSPHALEKVKEAYEKVLFPNLLATTLFLEMIRDIDGASYTVAGGPFTHHCPSPELYNTSLASATLNHYGTILKFNTAASKVRGNTLCCHYAVGYPDEIVAEGSKSSFGDLLDKDFGPVSDCRAWGKAFVRVAKGTERLGFICMHDPPEVEVLVESKEWVWFPDEHKYGPSPPVGKNSN
mmetsp:Transcript_10688/g.15733  ORF Transcript_10688/g.15733 Transcript_10688/m.15733 type:complete len:282 (-) Transcript_10688:75-920(-)|eukprot:CAMPEP_0194206274 /NCGR_PEP_ID=MMETSP0156-20130528/5349_1 /TAXON_ID=33649 /ORGANISM="Thalassionema nitzschioides, Strain L26-B" /LENGTH=281 /DNA_ID=CAMNT_0038932753 /DNA_START=40 /DNA_END=885 /DNA_ORIENTATION=-